MSTALRFPVELDVGAATHTGCVRTGNEDDYLVLPAQGATALQRAGVLVAVADGMGGVRGGAEASRAAIRWLGAAWLEAAGDADEVAAADDFAAVERQVRAGFDTASRRVHELAHSSPGLRDMGTTMTALAVRGRRGLIAHVGDTRCLRVRRGELEQLTVDHAMAGSRNLLTRCIGAGQLREEVDLVPVDVADRDSFILCSDGVWTLLEPAECVALVRGGGNAQRAAERLVQRAVERGAPDNCTAVVLRVREAVVPNGRTHEVRIPAGELEVGRPPARGSARSLIPPRWPWLGVVLGVAFAVLAWLRAVHGIDVFARVADWWH